MVLGQCGPQRPTHPRSLLCSRSEAVNRLLRQAPSPWVPGASVGTVAVGTPSQRPKLTSSTTPPATTPPSLPRACSALKGGVEAAQQAAVRHLALTHESQALGQVAKASLPPAPPARGHLLPCTSHPAACASRLPAPRALLPTPGAEPPEHCKRPEGPPGLGLPWWPTPRRRVITRPPRTMLKFLFVNTPVENALLSYNTLIKRCVLPRPRMCRCTHG